MVASVGALVVPLVAVSVEALEEAVSVAVALVEVGNVNILPLINNFKTSLGK